MGVTGEQTDVELYLLADGMKEMGVGEINGKQRC